MASSATVMIYSVFLCIFLLNPSSFTTAQSNNNVLYSGENLLSGNSLTHGPYSFIMQDDCNLVLYDGSSAIWSSGTHGQASNCHCSMQNDGNLVVYRPNGTPLWASNTNIGQGNYVLILQKDRNVVIYGSPIWATNTNSNSFVSKRDGGMMNVVSITNLPAPIIYNDDGAKNVTERITTRAGRVA